jgi:predicted nucleic acid-binding protein
LDKAADELALLIRTDADIIAPYLLQSEFASGIRGLEARNRIDEWERQRSWFTFRRLDIDYRWDDSWVERALEIAAEAGLSKVYDSIYLACAEAYGFELLTCDVRYARATHHPLLRLLA